MALRSFRGGAHPLEHKELTEHKPLEVMPPPAEIFVPLAQHLGKPASPLVKKGDHVRQGQVLAEASGGRMMATALGPGFSAAFQPIEAEGAKKP